MLQLLVVSKKKDPHIHSGYGGSLTGMFFLNLGRVRPDTAPRTTSDMKTSNACKNMLHSQRHCHVIKFVYSLTKLLEATLLDVIIASGASSREEVILDDVETWQQVLLCSTYH